MLRTATNAPEALAAARDTVRTRDENRFQGAVERRAEELIRYAERRRRVLRDELTLRQRKTGQITRRIPSNPPEERKASDTRVEGTPPPNPNLLLKTTPQ